MKEQAPDPREYDFPPDLGGRLDEDLDKIGQFNTPVESQDNLAELDRLSSSYPEGDVRRRARYEMLRQLLSRVRSLVGSVSTPGDGLQVGVKPTIDRAIGALLEHYSEQPDAHGCALWAVCHDAAAAFEHAAERSCDACAEDFLPDLPQRKDLLDFRLRVYEKLLQGAREVNNGKDYFRRLHDAWDRIPSREVPYTQALCRVFGLQVPGEQFGAETLVNLTGVGAYATTYSSHRGNEQYLECVKIPLPERDPGRLLREARLLKEVQYQGIVGIRYFDVTPVPHLVMDYSPGGRTLEDVFNQQHGPLASQNKYSSSTIIGWFIPLMRDLDQVHKKHLIIHCDLKLSNILFDEQKKCRVIDLGSGYLMDPSEAIHNPPREGTPGYIPPEYRVGAQPPSPVTDVYSLGAALCLLLTGRISVPKREGQGFQKGELFPDDLSLDGVLRKALHPLPKQRYQSMLEFAGELQLYQSGQLPDAAPNSRLRKLLARGSGFFARAAVLALALLIVLLSLLPVVATFKPVWVSGLWDSREPEEKPPPPAVQPLHAERSKEHQAHEDKAVAMYNAQGCQLIEENRHLWDPETSSYLSYNKIRMWTDYPTAEAWNDAWSILTMFTRWHNEDPRFHFRSGNLWLYAARWNKEWDGTPPDEMSLRCLSRARDEFQQAVTTAEDRGNLEVQAAAHNNLALVYRMLGDYERAVYHGLLATSIMAREPKIELSIKVCYYDELVQALVARARQTRQRGGDSSLDVRLAVSNAKNMCSALEEYSKHPGKEFERGAILGRVKKIKDVFRDLEPASTELPSLEEMRSYQLPPSPEFTAAQAYKDPQIADVINAALNER